MLLSRMSLDLRAGASQRPKNHPSEAPQLSLPPCPMRVYLMETRSTRGWYGRAAERRCSVAVNVGRTRMIAGRRG